MQLYHLYSKREKEGKEANIELDIVCLVAFVRVKEGVKGGFSKDDTILPPPRLKGKKEENGFCIGLMGGASVLCPDGLVL